MIIKVLIVDEHPIIIDAYKNALKLLSVLNQELEFDIETANSCELSSSKVNKSIKSKVYYDLVFLDIKLPPSGDNKVLGGIDLGCLIRKKSRGTKIFVSTAFKDSYMITFILRNVNPDALLVTKDLTRDILIDAIKNILSDPPYYSKTVIKVFRKQSSNDFILDDIDRKILHELSKGTKMSELPKILLLSIAALERRKRILKEIFNAEGKGDRHLLQLAHEKGFI